MLRSAPRNEATKSLAGRGEQVVGRVVLLEHAADVEHRHPVAEGHRLVDVVGDEHDGLAHLRLEVEQLVLEPGPHDRVDGAEGLVHQQHRRVGGQGPGHARPAAAGRPRARPGSGAAASRSRPDEVDQLLDPRA